MATTAGSTRINIDLALNTRGFRPLGRINGQLGEFEKSLDASNARVLAFGASAGAILAVKKAFTATVKAAIEVEKSLKDINVILQVSSGNLQKFGSQLFKIASDTGQAFSVAAEAATELARQGLGVEETLKRTKDALILARLAGMNAADAVNALTAALNTFEQVGLSSTVIINKLANVDAAFAVSSEDLAKALGRVGSAAVSAGVDLDQLLAIVTTAQQKTARGGAVIGNSFKTIFTRIQRPRVIKELENLGVQVRGLEGSTLPAIRVLENLAKQFDNLSQSQRAQITELVGGVFQVNVLKAALSDLSKEQGIYNRALAISAGSSDQALRRNEELNETLAAQFQKTLNTFKEAAAELGTLTLGPAMENIFGAVNKTFESAAGDTDLAKAGQFIGKTVFESIGKFIGGPGLLIIGGVLFKTFANLATFAADAFRTLTGLNKNFQNQLNLQKQIFGVLSENPDLMNRIRTGTLSVEDAHRLVLERINDETSALDRQLLVSQQIATSLSGSGVGFSADFGATAGGTRKFGPRPKGKSRGYVPNFADDELLGMMMGGYSNSQLSNPKIRKSLIHDGRGGAFSANTNGHESIVDFTNGKGKKATAVVPPKGSGAHEDFIKALSGGYVPNFANFNIGGRSLTGAGIAAGIRNKTITKQQAKDAGYISTADKKAKDAKSKAKKQEREQAKRLTNTFDVKQRFGGLALFGESGTKRTIPVKTAEITKLAALSRKDKGLKYPSTIYFKNFQEKSFLGEVKSRDNNNAFSRLIKKHMAKPMETITNEFAQQMGLRDDAPKVTASKISTTGNALFPVGAEGSIFETAISAMTKNAKSFEAGLGDSQQALWDFEESGNVDERFKNKFGYTGLLQKADAKRSLDAGAWNSIGNKIFSTLVDRGGNPKSTSSLAKQLAALAKGGKAGGFIPSFSAVHNAVQRERSAGVPMNKIRVGVHKSLASGLNPSGLGVYNTRDEPSGLSQGVRRSLARGHNPKTAGIPNFAADAASDSKSQKNISAMIKLQAGLFAATTGITGLKNALGDATEANRNTRIGLSFLDKSIQALIMALTVKELFSGTKIGDKIGGMFSKEGGSKAIGSMSGIGRGISNFSLKDKILGKNVARQLQGPGLVGPKFGPGGVVTGRVGGLFGGGGVASKVKGFAKSPMKGLAGMGKGAMGGMAAAGPMGVAAGGVLLSEGLNVLIDDVLDNASKELDSANIAFKRVTAAAEKNINSLTAFQKATSQAAAVFGDSGASVRDVIKANKEVQKQMAKLPSHMKAEIQAAVDPAEMEAAVQKAIETEQQRKQDVTTRKDLAQEVKNIGKEGFYAVSEPGKMWDSLFKSQDKIDRERGDDERTIRGMAQQATQGISDEKFMGTSNQSIQDTSTLLSNIASTTDTGALLGINDLEGDIKKAGVAMRELGYSEEMISSFQTAMEGDSYQRELVAEQLRNEIQQRKRDADANAALNREREKLLRIEAQMQKEIDRSRKTLEVEQKIRKEAMKITQQAAGVFLTATGKIDMATANKVATIRSDRETAFGQTVGSTAKALGKSRLTTGLSGDALTNAQGLESEVQSAIAFARDKGVGSLGEGALDSLLDKLTVEKDAATSEARKSGIDKMITQLQALNDSSVRLESEMANEIKATREVAEFQKMAARQAQRLKMFGGSAAAGNPAAMDGVISRLRGSSIAGGIARRTGSASGADAAAVNRFKAVAEVHGGELPEHLRAKAQGAAFRDRLRSMRNVNSMLAPGERMDEGTMRKAAAEQAQELFKGHPLDQNTEAVRENTKAMLDFMKKGREGQVDIANKQIENAGVTQFTRDWFDENKNKFTRDADVQFNNLNNQNRDWDHFQDIMNSGMSGQGDSWIPGPLGELKNKYDAARRLPGAKRNLDESTQRGKDMAKRMDAGQSRGARGDITLTIPEGSADNKKIQALFQKYMSQQNFNGQSHGGNQTAAAGAR